MPILLQCPQCKARMKAPDGSEGRKAKCPRCGTLIPILAADAAPSGGEEDVEGGDDAGLFTTAKKPSSAKPKPPAPPAKPAKAAAKNSDFEFVEEDEDDEEEKQIQKKKRKIETNYVEEDEVKPRKKKPSADDDEEDESLNFAEEEEDEPEEEEEDRPRRKKKKKKKRRRSGSDDIDPNLIQNGWYCAGGAIGLALFSWCCCPFLFIPISSLMAIAAVCMGIALLVKGDPTNGIVQAALGGLALAINIVDIYVVLVWMPANNMGGF